MISALAKLLGAELMLFCVIMNFRVISNGACVLA